MDSEFRDCHEKVELKLSEQDERIIAQDKSLTAIRNLLRTGIRMLVDAEVKIDALAASDAKLYVSLRQLSEAQQRTGESLRRFLDRSANGHS